MKPKRTTTIDPTFHDDNATRNNAGKNLGFVQNVFRFLGFL